MLTPPNSNQQGYMTPFGGASGTNMQMPPAFFSSPFAFGTARGNQRGAPTQTLSGFMQGRGWEEDRMNPGGYMQRSASGKGATRRMDARSAELLFRGSGGFGGAAAQGMMAAGTDFENLSSIIDQSNAQRADYLGMLGTQYGQIEADRLAAVSGLTQQGTEQAAKIREQGDLNFEEFEKFRDEQLDTSAKYVKDLSSRIDSYISNFEENMNLSAMSAASGMRQANTEKQINDMMTQASLQGMDESQMASMEYQIRGQASREIHGQVAQLQQTQNQMLAQMSMQGAQQLEQAYGRDTAIRGQAVDQTRMALAQRQSAYETAGQWEQMGRLQSVQANLQFERAKTEVGAQMANALANLGQRYPSMYDAFLQGAYAGERFGRQPELPMFG